MDMVALLWPLVFELLIKVLRRNRKNEDNMFTDKAYPSVYGTAS